MTQHPTPASPPAQAPSPRTGPHIGPLRITLPVAVVALVLVGSTVFIGYVAMNVHDNQIPLLAVGFVALGASWAAIAIGSLVGMWRAASYASSGRAFALAIVGGLAGLAAIGCFAITALLTLVWNT